MKRNRVREKITVALNSSVAFKGTHLVGSEFITVPKPIIRKLLDSGDCRARCNGTYTDDYYGDAQRNFSKGCRTLEQMSAEIADWTQNGCEWQSTLNTHYPSEVSLVCYSDSYTIILPGPFVSHPRN